jgi:protein-S-isoprenylcysteine O-methyltransferase Ste14
MIAYSYLFVILLFFILAFGIKNLITYISTKKSIKGKSKNLTFSVIISSAIYSILLLRLTFLDSIFEIFIPLHNLLKIFGYLLVTVGFCIGISALIAMKNSWRVGIIHNQKTVLITSGVYKFSRNPYFLSYEILILGFILIFPSPILAILYISLIITFHGMILDEENYLREVHRNSYLDYSKKVNRYFTLNI